MATRPTSEWVPWFAWRPVSTIRLHTNGYFYPDRVAWLQTVWRRRAWHGGIQHALIHPITDAKP